MGLDPNPHVMSFSNVDRYQSYRTMVGRGIRISPIARKTRENATSKGQYGQREPKLASRHLG